MNGERRFPWLRYLLAFIVITLVALSPLFSVIIASVLAGANGCTLDEGSIHPCMIAGSDWGETLYSMGVLGWFMLATIPLGGIALVLLAAILFIHRTAWWRARRPTQ